MGKVGYRYFAYLDTRTGERYISVGTKVLISKLKISKATLYNRLDKDGWFADYDCMIFRVEQKDVLHDPPKNNNLEIVNRNRKLKNKDKTDTHVNEIDSGAKTVPIPKQDHTERISKKTTPKMNKKPDEVKGESGGSQNGDHEKVPDAPLPSVTVIEKPVVVSTTDTSGDRWAKAVQEQKEKEKPPKKEVVVPPIDPSVESLAQAAVHKQKEDEMAKQKAKEDAERIAKEKRESLLI